MFLDSDPLTDMSPDDDEDARPHYTESTWEWVGEEIHDTDDDAE